MKAPHPCPHCGGLILVHQGQLEAWQEETLPHYDAEAAAKLPEYEKALKLCQSMVTNGKRDMEIAGAAARGLAEIESAGLIEIPAEEEITALKTKIETLKHDRGNQQAGIRMLEEADRHATEADEKTRRAASLHQDVQAWEAIADALAPYGIPGEMLAEALEPINARLATSGNTAEWKRINIGADMSIFSAQEGGLPRPYALLSESEKWRADAMIAEAIAHLSGIKLLVLDRFDVLDLKGREDLIAWLDILAQDGEIDTALIFGTLKALPAQLPETVEAFWIEGGVVGQVGMAA